MLFKFLFQFKFIVIEVRLVIQQNPIIKMIAIDLGNKFTTISDGNNTLTKETTVIFTANDKIEIGHNKARKNVIYDLVILLGVKFMDQEFSRSTKFYEYDFERAKNGKIMIRIPKYQSMRYKLLHIDTIMAIYMKKLIDVFRIMYHSVRFPELKQFVENHKFYVTVSGAGTHPFRYSLKQTCQMVGIESPILVNSSHMAMCSYYNTNKQTLNEIQEICVIQFGDKGATGTVYKLQSYEQKILEVLEHKYIRIGGYHLTKCIAEFMVNRIKDEKGMDINKYSYFMRLLSNQCENAKINVVQSKEKESFVGIADLPDNSAFGKVLNQKLMIEIMKREMNKVIGMIEILFKKHPNIKEVLMMGGSIKLPLFQQKIKQLSNKYLDKVYREIRKVSKQTIYEGILTMQNEEIIIFDIAQAQYEVKGQEGFKRKLLQVGEDIPQRKWDKTKFPAGELQFNLKLFEDGIKVGHFLLQSRPSQVQFGLNFQIDRNKLAVLYVKTDKGKVDCPADYEALTYDQVLRQSKIVDQYL